MHTIGPERAAELYRCFALDTFAAAEGVDADIIVAAAQPEDLEAVSALVGLYLWDSLYLQAGQVPPLS